MGGFGNMMAGWLLGWLLELAFLSTPMETSNDESYAGRSLSVKTSLICRPPSFEGEAFVLNNASYLNENENVDILKRRRFIKDHNVLHIYNHFKPPQNFIGYLAMSPMVNGTLLNLIKGVPTCLYTSSWFGSPTLSSILRQIATTINDLHEQGITLGVLSTTSIFYVMENFGDPSIKLDWTLKENGRYATLKSRKMNDWRLFADLLWEIYQKVYYEAHNISFLVEFENLRRKLRSEYLDLDTVKNFIVSHPALWNGERSLFLLEFVRQMVSKMKVGDQRLKQAIKHNEDSILPLQHRKNWTMHFSKETLAFMDSFMDGGRFEYRQRNYQKGPQKYDGNSVVDYIHFMRDYIRHCYEYEEDPSDRELVFRKMQPTTIFKLYTIVQAQGRVNNFLKTAW